MKHPSKLVNPGDAVDVEVLGVDPKNRRISLGMKQMQPNPWETLRERYHIGTRVRGRVRNLTDFGAFVEVEDGVDGLVHVSDISWNKRIKHPGEVLEEGAGDRGRHHQHRHGEPPPLALDQGHRAERVGEVRQRAQARRHRPRQGSRASPTSARSSSWPRASKACATSRSCPTSVWRSPRTWRRSGRRWTSASCASTPESKKIGLSARAAKHDEPSHGRQELLDRGGAAAWPARRAVRLGRLLQQARRRPMTRRTASRRRPSFPETSKPRAESRTPRGASSLSPAGTFRRRARLGGDQSFCTAATANVLAARRFTLVRGSPYLLSYSPVLVPLSSSTCPSFTAEAFTVRPERWRQ